MKNSELFDDATYKILNGEGINWAMASRIMESVINSSSFVPCVAHPLGFAHIELTTLARYLPDNTRLRLHIWTEETAAWADQLGSLHDHIWELNSAVLLGTVTDRYLKPKESPSGNMRAIRIEYGDGDSNQSRALDGNFELEEAGIRKVSSGEVYTLPPRLVHFTLVDSYPTVTLVVAIDKGGPGPTVYLPRGESLPPAGERTPLPKEWVSSNLLGILSKCRSGN